MARVAAEFVAVIAGFLAAPAARAQEPDEPQRLLADWAFDVSAYAIDPPHDGAYVSTILRADRDALHLEGRWNYEDRHTGSVWAGWNLGWDGLLDEHFELAVTPMAGVVAGDTDGVAPGLLVDASWRIFSLWSESEYVFDLDDSDDDYFYCWNELTVAPVEWLWFGLVAQRTRAYDQELSVDRGLLLGGAIGPVEATGYWFNPDDGDESYFSFALGFAF